jgi:ferredoxin
MPDSRLPSSLRLRVNPIQCAAFGFCAEYAPELFALDEWGYAWPHGREVSAQHVELAREAARLCPTRAILLEALTTPPVSARRE